MILVSIWHGILVNNIEICLHIQRSWCYQLLWIWRCTYLLPIYMTGGVLTCNVHNGVVHSNSVKINIFLLHDISSHLSLHSSAFLSKRWHCSFLLLNSWTSSSGTARTQNASFWNWGKNFNHDKFTDNNIEVVILVVCIGWEFRIVIGQVESRKVGLGSDQA